MRVSILAMALLPLLACAAGCHPAGADDPVGLTARPDVGPDPHEITAMPTAGTAVYVGAEELRDYRPRPMLEVETTNVDAARYPAVDIHCHWRLDRDPAAMLEAMDERNVTRAVNLSGGWGEALDAMLDRFHAAAPERLLIFANVDFSTIDDPDFAPRWTGFLRDARERGVSGLKVFKSLGLWVRDASGELVAVDDPRLDPIWATCGQLGLPVLIHTADPAAFFEPVDRHNERWMQLTRRPQWRFDGPDFPERAELLAQRNRVIARHPDTMFICAHMGGYAGDLAAASRFLDEHLNAFLDISGRVAELGRQPYTTRRFLIAQQDRILFGTDRAPGRVEQPRYRIYYRFLETDDEYFSYYDHPYPPAGEWRIYGVHLPDAVLGKIYHENADRLLGGAGPR